VRRAARAVALLIEARRQARFPFRSPAVIARARRRRVRSLVRHAWANVPFYREAIDRLGASSRDFVDAADLARLPIVARIVGRPTGYGEAVFTMLHSTTMEVQEYVRSRLRLPSRLGVRRAYFPLDADLDENLRRLAEFRPHGVHGYGSYIGPLLRRAAETARVPPNLKVATYSSDGMTDPDRRYITEHLRIPVLCTYQAVEAFKIGFECGESEWIHVNDDLYPVRIVDRQGRDAAPGESGSVIVSNLVNRATVLFNYRIGDRAALLHGSCLCGRTLPRMTRPLGREGEWLALVNGKRRQRFSERLGAIEIEWVDTLERTADGKVRTFATEAP
jgi:phenylacetate-coenzyme A ligase PaaK-like adenylate-forming protein